MRKKYKKGGSYTNNQTLSPSPSPTPLSPPPQIKVNDGPPPQPVSSPPNPSMDKAQPGKAPPLGKAPQPGKATPGNITPSGESSESDSSMFSGLFTSLDEYKAEIGIGFCVTLLIIIAIVGYNKYKETAENEEIEETKKKAETGEKADTEKKEGSKEKADTKKPSNNSSNTTSEGFINYIKDYVNSIFEPGRPDINEDDKNKLLPGFIL